MPPHVIPILRLHLDEYAGKERLFVSRDGSPLRGKHSSGLAVKSDSTRSHFTTCGTQGRPSQPKPALLWPTS
jgi:hypothetical protein